MPEYIPSPIKWVADQVELYESSGGLDGNTLWDTGQITGMSWDTKLPVVLVTSIGGKTGAIRKNPLMKVVDGDNYILVASQGGRPKNPVWYYNFKANPKVQLRDKTEVFDMLVSEVTEPGERSRLWNLAVAAYPPYEVYQGRTDRLIPIFSASPIS